MELKNLPHNYKIMSEITYSCQYNVVFCTKSNKKILTGNIKEELEKMLRSCQEIFGFEIVDISINLSFVHIIFFCNPHLSPAKLITNLKKHTASLLINAFPELKTKMQSIWTRQALIVTTGSIEMRVITNFLEDQIQKKKKEK